MAPDEIGRNGINAQEKSRMKRRGTTRYLMVRGLGRTGGFGKKFPNPQCVIECYFIARSAGRIGSLRILLPVAAKIALHTAGAAGGRPGSPMPPTGSGLGTV